MKIKKALFIFLVGLLFAIPCLSLYLMRNPDSLLSYGLFSVGIKIFEPSYMEKREGEKLIDGFESYASPTQVRASAPSTFSWSTTGKSNTDQDGVRPPDNSFSMSLKDYQYKGSTGELCLAFLNDRLMICSFYPVDVEEFKKTLTKDLKVTFIKGSRVKISRNIRLLYYIDYTNRHYFRWEDKRLKRESTALMMRYY